MEWDDLGLGLALLEQTKLDAKRVRYANDDIDVYPVTVDADMTEIDVILVPGRSSGEPARHQGQRRLRQCRHRRRSRNAACHASGECMRDLPTMIDKLI